MACPTWCTGGREEHVPGAEVHVVDHADLGEARPSGAKNGTPWKISMMPSAGPRRPSRSSSDGGGEHAQTAARGARRGRRRARPRAVRPSPVRCGARRRGRPPRGGCATWLACFSEPPASGSSRSRKAKMWIRRSPPRRPGRDLGMDGGGAGAVTTDGWTSGERRCGPGGRLSSLPAPLPPLVPPEGPIIASTPTRSLVIPMFDEATRIGAFARGAAGVGAARRAPRGAARRRRQPRRHPRGGRGRWSPSSGWPARGCVRLPSNRGKGAAVRAGMLAAGGRAPRVRRRRPLRGGRRHRAVLRHARVRARPRSCTARGPTPAAPWTRASPATGSSPGGSSTTCCAGSASPRSSTRSAGSRASPPTPPRW